MVTMGQRAGCLMLMFGLFRVFNVCGFCDNVSLWLGFNVWRGNGVSSLRRPYQTNPTSYRTTYPIPNIPTGEPSCQELGNVNAASPRGRVVRAALTLTLGYHGGLQSIAEHVGAPGQWLAWHVEPARLRRMAWRWMEVRAPRPGCAERMAGDGSHVI